MDSGFQMTFARVAPSTVPPPRPVGVKMYSFQSSDRKPSNDIVARYTGFPK